MSTIRALALGLVTTVFVAACTGSLPPVAAAVPQPPFTNPNIFGRPNQAVQPIATFVELEECLATGLSGYGVTLQTSNVRSAPSTNACRLGKLPRGTLVEITGLVSAPGAKPAARPTPAPTPTPAPVAAAGPTIGYTDDIQPIFSRVCVNCHGPAVQLQNLQVTEYGPLMKGGVNGPVVVPGDPAASKLWEMLETGKMPLLGVLTDGEKALVRQWILEGAAQRRAAPPSAAASAAADAPAAVPASSGGAWVEIAADTKLTAVSDACKETAAAGQTLISGDLILPVSCATAPTTAELNRALAGKGLPVASAAAARPANSTDAAQGEDAGKPAAAGAAATAGETSSAAASAPVAAVSYAVGAAAGAAGIQASALGLPAPADGDPFMTPSGFCLDRRLADNPRGITALTFAPDGRMFLALDSNLASDIDPLVLYDAYHPSRSVAIYDPANDSLNEIMVESTRITGLDYENGALYLSRAGEVGRIPDGGEYEALAGGFAVASQLFHANNGIVVSDGWVYVSAGGIRDGYVEGPVVGVGEAGAQQIVSGGNPYAARIVRAPLDALLGSRSIGAFSTAGRGVRNPYGITRDPSGRIWFTDNGATNVPDEISAGDEVNLLNPGAVGGGEDAAPYYGFPLALNGSPPDWYTEPVVALPNSAAPTGIAWAFDTIFFAQYGRFPGLYRLGRAADGTVVAERVMQGWPILALGTAPDGALWIGMGNGALYRMVPC
jgi:hypothetical protein